MTPGVALADGIVIQAEALEAAGLEVLDEDIGAVGKLLRQPQVFCILEVEDDRSLVTVDGQVVGGDAVADGRYPGAGIVARRAFDFDDGRAEVAEQHGAVGASEHPREIGDEQAIEWAWFAPILPVMARMFAICRL